MERPLILASQAPNPARRPTSTWELSRVKGRLRVDVRSSPMHTNRTFVMKGATSGSILRKFRVKIDGYFEHRSQVCLADNNCFESLCTTIKTQKEVALLPFHPWKLLQGWGCPRSILASVTAFSSAKCKKANNAQQHMVSSISSIFIMLCCPKINVVSQQL